MNSTLSRRQMLTATASTLIAIPVAYATTLCGEESQIIRKMAIWNSGLLRCWCELYASDAIAVDDMEDLWSERTIVDHINIENFEHDLNRVTTNSLPTLRLGCAASNSLIEASTIAFSRAGAEKLRNMGKVYWSGVAAISISDESRFLDTLKSMRSWINVNLPYDAFFDIQMLIDRTLNGNNKRVSVALVA